MTLEEIAAQSIAFDSWVLFIVICASATSLFGIGVYYAIRRSCDDVVLVGSAVCAIAIVICSAKLVQLKLSPGSYIADKISGRK